MRGGSTIKCDWLCALRRTWWRCPVRADRPGRQAEDGAWLRL